MLQFVHLVSDPIAVSHVHCLQLFEKSQQPLGVNRIVTPLLDFGNDLTLPADVFLTVRDVPIGSREVL
jgi:hypothetical protein